MRAEIFELQQAQVGVKRCGAADRRALDPPPVVGLKVYRTVQSGVDAGLEEEVPDYENLGPNSEFICVVDLFRVTEDRADREPVEHVVHSFDGYSVLETSKLPMALAGSTIVKPTLVDDCGKKYIVFIFPDLTVKKEGLFILRYRVHNIDPVVPQFHAPIEAEAYGGKFEVHPKISFPGYGPPTKLTIFLARFQPERSRQRRALRAIPEA